MTFDYKKEYKEFYMPKNKPSIVEIPEMNYISVRGHGDPNEENIKNEYALPEVLSAGASLPRNMLLILLNNPISHYLLI